VLLGAVAIGHHRLQASTVRAVETSVAIPLRIPPRWAALGGSQASRSLQPKSQPDATVEVARSGGGQPAETGSEAGALNVEDGERFVVKVRNRSQEDVHVRNPA
jgi:hypothetical protein